MLGNFRHLALICFLFYTRRTACMWNLLLTVSVRSLWVQFYLACGSVYNMALFRQQVNLYPARRLKCSRLSDMATRKEAFDASRRNRGTDRVKPLEADLGIDNARLDSTTRGARHISFRMHFQLQKCQFNPCAPDSFPIP